MTAIEAAEKVRNELASRGFKAYLVGGCVRDLLLGREPKDYDITTNAVPEEVQFIFPKTVPVGAAFGVVVVIEEGHQIEVATFRADGEYSDARRPDFVTYSSHVREDVTRRDFTINGMLLVGAPSDKAMAAHEATIGRAEYLYLTLGEKQEMYAAIDLVGGLKDIRSKLIRCIGEPEARFGEDALRMLRAVRFAAQLGFEIEPSTEAAIRKMAGTITKISKERIAAELFKLLSAPFPVKGLTALITTGLAEHVLPPFGTYALRRFAQFPTNDPMKGMAMLMVDVATKHDTQVTVGNAISLAAHKFCRSLKLSNDQLAFLEGTRHPSLTVLDALSLADLKRLARLPGILMGLEILEQEAAIDNDTFTPAFAEAAQKLRGFTPEEIRPKPLLTGDDLIAAGMKPGPIFTTLLGGLETQQLDDKVKTRADAIAYMIETLAKMGIQMGN